MWRRRPLVEDRPPPPAKRQRGHLTSSHDLVASRCLRAQSLFLWSPVQLGRLPAPGAPGPGGQVLQRAERLIFRLRLVPLGLWEAGAVPLTPSGSSPGGAWVPGVRGGANDRRCGCQVILGLPGSLGSPGVTRQQATQEELTQGLHCGEMGTGSLGTGCQRAAGSPPPPDPQSWSAAVTGIPALSLLRQGDSGRAAGAGPMALTVFQSCVCESVHAQRAREGQHDGVPAPAAPVLCVRRCRGGKPARPLIVRAAPALGALQQRRALPLEAVLGPSTCCGGKCAAGEGAVHPSTPSSGCRGRERRLSTCCGQCRGA